jgi:histidinol phosphatase-like enzyme
MKYTIYKTTNLINDKIYIGKHKTINPNDNYLGSGTAIKHAIKKYGRENFVKEILYIFDNEADMNAKEKELVTLDFIKENTNYNETLGGRGSWSHIDQSGHKNPMKRNDVKQKVIKFGKITRNKNKQYYDDISRKNLKRAIDNNIGRKRPEHSKLMKNHMNALWANKEKFRDYISSTYKLISPSNDEFITNRLSDFAKEHNLAFTTLCTNDNGRVPIKGKNKGWSCIRLTKKGNK